ncbi:D-ribose pyranase [Cutibacterium sp. WCA-380-WT-3A]|uniref:D-ribose pyranase n=1 Tax=Cutibacterium porci TaxID=2605781 RepID=A0A7K0J440_9ACTN|nr:D-ribose pyranase [Cutibacterium porci]MSS44693.1 D-ribose pyranase [Cutibacterium porci]
MKKSGLLNPQLCAAVARLGHTQSFVVADAGLPIPREVPVIDLALVLGVPRFQEVFDAILDEVVVDGATIATEAINHEPEQWVRSRIEEVDAVSHEDLKRLLPSVSFVVRTGETTPYSNVVVHCGVPF